MVPLGRDLFDTGLFFGSGVWVVFEGLLEVVICAGLIKKIQLWY